MEKEILLLGHKGMLGQMVNHYFTAKGHEIITLKHRFDADQKEAFIDEIKAHPDALIINAIGKIKQKTNDSNELLCANAILPLTLRQITPDNQRIVHPSTDCVFKGDLGMPYSIETEPNAMDDYGWSKRLGEVSLEGRPNTLIVRVSIIGPDDNPEGKGLLNWFLQQPKGSGLKGYSNHHWNGITTLEWCKQTEHLLTTDDQKKSSIYQLGTKESYTKNQMLQLFQKYFQTDYQIQDFEAHESIDRRLQPNIITKPLEEQLKDLVELIV